MKVIGYLTLVNLLLIAIIFTHFSFSILSEVQYIYILKLIGLITLAQFQWIVLMFLKLKTLKLTIHNELDQELFLELSLGKLIK